MKYKVLVLTTITLLSTAISGNSKNILSLKESITDNAIVYPSSFETDTKEMMENWYLKNYAIIDQSKRCRVHKTTQSNAHSDRDAI